MLSSHPLLVEQFQVAKPSLYLLVFSGFSSSYYLLPGLVLNFGAVGKWCACMLLCAFGIILGWVNYCFSRRIILTNSSFFFFCNLQSCGYQRKFFNGSSSKKCVYLYSFLIKWYVGKESALRSSLYLTKKKKKGM